MITGSILGGSFFGGFGAAAKTQVVKPKPTPSKGPAAVARKGVGHFVQAPAAVPPSPTSAKRLQVALAALGKVAKSPSLSAVKADGALGAKSVAAVNLAFTKHIGSGQADAQYRTGKLTLAYIKSNADMLASLIEAETRRRGGVTVSTTAAIAKTAQAIAAGIPQKVTIAPATALRLQTAMVLLGRLAKSPSLSAIKVDGVLGAKSATAVNLVFTKHIGAGQADAQYRTGKLPLDYIKANASTLASLIETEVKRRGGILIPIGTAAQIALALKVQAAKEAGAAKAAKAAAAKAVAAKKKADAAAARAAAKQQKAIIAKAKAAKARASGDTSAAQAYETEATQENVAAQADLNTQAEANAEAQVAAQDAAVAAKVAQTEAVAAEPSMAPPSAVAPTAYEPPPATSPSLTPLPESVGPTQADMTTMPSVDFISQYKWPIIAGVVALAGLGFALSREAKRGMPGRSTSATAPTTAPIMGRARRKR